jgi:hypothetical protein
MKKIIAAVSTLFIAIALSLVAVAAPASAHTATLTGSVACNSADGSATVTWTLDNDYNEVLNVTASNNAAIPVGATVAAIGNGSNRPDTTKTFTQVIPAPAGGHSATATLSFKWSGDNFTQTDTTFTTNKVSTDCVVPPTKDASAAIVDTPAACAAAETVALGAITNATWGTLHINGSSWNATATATNGHVFANSNGGSLSNNNTVDKFSGTLDSALSPGRCQVASAAVVTTAATCQGPETVAQGAVTFATWTPTITYTTSGGVTTYKAIANATSGYEFPNGTGVSNNNTRLTLTGTIAGEITGHPCEDYIIVAWHMPSWVNSTTPTWSQTYFTSHEEGTPNLNALDSQLTEQCGVQYQVDIYYNSPTTASLIAGEHLDGPNNPPEDLIPGDWGVAYKLVQGPACATPATPSESDVCSAGGTITINAAVGVVYYLNGNPVDTTSGSATLSGLHGVNTVTAAATTGYLLTGYPSGGWSYNINTDCTATYSSSGDCTATDSGSQEDVTLSLVNPSSTGATFVVTSGDATVTPTGSYYVPADSTTVVDVGSVSDSGGTFSVSVNGGDQIDVVIDSFTGCIPTTPADPTFTSLTCAGSTAVGGSISTDGNPNLTYTLTGPDGFTPVNFPSSPATPTITGLAAGDYTVNVVANPGFVLSGATSFPVSITLDAVDCTGTPQTPEVSWTLPVCVPDVQLTSGQFNAADTEEQGQFSITPNANIDYTISNGGPFTAVPGSPFTEPDGTYTIVGTLTPAAIAAGFTFTAPGVGDGYTLNADKTIATWSDIAFGPLFCPPTLAAWNAGATSSDATCAAPNVGTITLNHSAGQADEVDYVVTNDATSHVVYSGTDSADTVLQVAPGHYTVTASPHNAGDGISGDAGPYHVVVAAAGLLCGNLAFTGGTIGWFGFALAGGMLFLGIAFLYMKRRGNRTAE